MAASRRCRSCPCRQGICRADDIRRLRRCSGATGGALLAQRLDHDGLDERPGPGDRGDVASVHSRSPPRPVLVCALRPWRCQPRRRRWPRRPGHVASAHRLDAARACVQRLSRPRDDARAGQTRPPDRCRAPTAGPSLSPRQPILAGSRINCREFTEATPTDPTDWPLEGLRVLDVSDDLLA